MTYAELEKLEKRIMWELKWDKGIARIRRDNNGYVGLHWLRTTRKLDVAVVKQALQVANKGKQRVHVLDGKPLRVKGGPEGDTWCSIYLKPLNKGYGVDCSWPRPVSESLGQQAQEEDGHHQSDDMCDYS